MDFESMFLYFSILTIVIGFGLLYFGLKWYGTSLSISFFVPGFMGLNMFGFIDLYPIYKLGPIIGISIFIFFFSRPLTYLVSWIFIFGVLSLLLFSITNLIGIESPLFIALVCLAISIIFVWIIRVHLRAVNIGLAGGASISMGTLFFLFPNFLDMIKGFSTEETTMATILFPMLWMVAWMIGGIVFQFLYRIPKTEKISD